MRSEEALVSNLCSAESIEWRTGREGLDRTGAIATVGRGFEAFAYIRSMMDPKAASVRLKESIRKESLALEQIRRTLGNEGFLSKASAEIIEEKRGKQEELSRKIVKMQGYIEDLER